MHVLYGVVLYYAKDWWEKTVLSFQRLELVYNQPEVHVFRSITILNGFHLGWNKT